jgi:hypothetical protein
MKLSVFQYIILWHPTDKQIKDDSKQSILLAGPKIVLAAAIDQVRMSAAMDIPTEYRDQLSQIEIGVRPF